VEQITDQLLPKLATISVLLMCTLHYGQQLCSLFYHANSITSFNQQQADMDTFRELTDKGAHGMFLSRQAN